MGHSTIEVTAFHFRTDWLWLWQVWQFEAYFRCNFCQVNSCIAEHTAQLFRTTCAYMCADGIRDGLVGQRATHLIAVAPQHSCLLRFLRPACKLSCQACFANARLTTNKDRFALSIANLTISLL